MTRPRTRLWKKSGTNFTKFWITTISAGAAGAKQDQKNKQYYYNRYNKENSSEDNRNFNKGFATADKYYSTLGIEPGATKKEVKEAYVKKAKQYHPDVQKDPAAEEKMKQVNLAYEFISNAL